MHKNNNRSAQALKGRIAESRDRLYRVAYAWCGDGMLADDLVQETMTTGIINGYQLRDKERLSAWLYSILHNNWYRHLRKSKPQTELDDKLPSNNFGPLGACQESEMVMQVRGAVATLPIEQRQVLALVDLEEFSYCEVAEILDIPIGTVMSRLHRARKNLLAWLKGPESHAISPQDHIRIVK